MTNKEYRALVKHLGLRRVDVAWLTGCTPRSVHRWSSGRTAIPQMVALLLMALAEGRLTPRWFRKRIPEPVPYSEPDYDRLKMANRRQADHQEP